LARKRAVPASANASIFFISYNFKMFVPGKVRIAYRRKVKIFMGPSLGGWVEIFAGILISVVMFEKKTGAFDFDKALQKPVDSA
jgi:hypothetical protein